ncbi:MAG: hypothetical protein SNJ62_02905, partial [Chloracidobacterium sp.]
THNTPPTVTAAGAPIKLATKPALVSQVAFREGLAQTIAWYQNNPVWVARARSGEYRTYYAQMYGAL